MITTKAEVKSNLNITDTSIDDLLDNTLESFELSFLNYLNNYFITKENVYIGSISIEGSPAVLYLNNPVRFLSGTDVMIANSTRNDGRYTIDSVTTTYLTFTDDLTEENSNYARISEMVYPKELAYIVALAFYESVSFNKSAGVVSESWEGYSVTLALTGGFSSRLESMMRPYKKGNELRFA